MKREKAQQVRRTRGFSLVELLVVVVIIMVVSAFALPRIQTAIAQIRLRANATNVNGLVQQLRMQSVKDNRAYDIHTDPGVAANGFVTSIYIDSNGDGAFTPGEPSIPLTNDMLISDGVGGPATAPGSPAITVPPYIRANTVDMSFNERGLPCVHPPAAPACGTVTPYVIYLQQIRPYATPAWAAITVNQAGRIKAYTFSGGAAGTWN
jgi:prepilin-type N-terminal cleavage/methylation domain-containing protein